MDADARTRSQLVDRLRALGVDMVDVTSGGNTPLQRIRTGPGYQVEMARAVTSA